MVERAFRLPLASALLFAGLLALGGRAARADDSPPGAGAVTERSTDMDHEDAGFGLDPGDDPRQVRIRLEGAFVGAGFDANSRHGHGGASNTINAHNDLRVPRWNVGGRGTIVLKLFRYFALGCEYLALNAEGARTAVRRDIRMGSIPSEIPQGARASGRTEFQQLNATLRFVIVDDSQFRAEFTGGFAWVSYRLGMHPAPPIPQGPFPAGGQFVGTSRAEHGFYAPTLGIFFAWNLIPSLAVFVDQYSGYVGVPLGSIMSYGRAGFRIHLGEGVEIVLAGFLLSGQVYDLNDNLSPPHAHIFKRAVWVGGGPDLGLSFTY